jgi:DNA-binding CsgD family transcriptional regulator
MLHASRTEFLGEAERFAREAHADPSAPNKARFYADCVLGGLAVIRGDAASAAACYQALAAHPDTPQSGIPMLLGLFARTAGRPDDAVACLRKAVERHERHDRVRGLFWARTHLAETLIQRAQPGDLAEARDLLDKVLAVAEETGSVLVERKAKALLGHFSSREEPGRKAGAGRPAWPDGLTNREVDVLRVVARGKTNQEIGFELFISPKTVDTHMRSILRKTASANRAEAAAYAARRGLAEPAD